MKCTLLLLAADAVEANTCEWVFVCNEQEAHQHKLLENICQAYLRRHLSAAAIKPSSPTDHMRH
jgi:hypothetical protein